MRTASSILDTLFERTRAAIEAAKLERLLPTLDYIERTQRTHLLQMVEATFAGFLASPPTPATRPSRGTERQILGARADVKGRTAANLAALALLASWMRGDAQVTSAQAQETLAGYSGWGGLSIEKIRAQLPPELPAPEKRGLIHEYYTPPAVADAIAAELVRLAPEPRISGRLQVLEPSAGIGRFVDALEGAFPTERLRWQLVEYSAVSAKLLTARFATRAPGRFDVSAGSFEAWAKDYPLEETDPLLQFDLIVSNPPYGPRGASLAEDGLGQHLKAAYPYFIWRTLGLLAPGGVAVYLVPGGMMTGTGKRLMKLREDVLKRAHLLGAFRMPSETPDGKDAIFPGAHLITDVLFLQRRPHSLSMVLPSDQRILDGAYFKDHPAHILGEEFGEDVGADDQSKKPRWGFGVRGIFEGFPDWQPRPLQGGLAAGTPKEETKRARNQRTKGSVAASAATLRDDAPEIARLAESIGLRAGEVLAAASSGDSTRMTGWEEVRADLEAWADAHGNPHKHAELLAASRTLGIERFLAAFTPKGQLQPAWTTPPQAAQHRYQGAKDVLSLADWLYRDKGGRMTLSDLVAFAERQGVSTTYTELQRQLSAASWCVDDTELEALWHPKDDYLQGDLWPRYDAALQRAERGDTQAARQVEWLLEVIQPAIFADLAEGLSPRDSWIPLEVIWNWIEQGKPKIRGGAVISRPATGLVRQDGGVITLEMGGKTLPYHKLPTNTKERMAVGLDRNLMTVLGYLNHDLAFFNPPVKKVYNTTTGEEELESLDAARVQVVDELTRHFRTWLRGQDNHQHTIEDPYNRAFKGYVPVTYSPEPVAISRWNPAYRLHPYQNAALRRMLKTRRGLLAFDVGLGKTFTGIALIARARQEGWARRPVVVVPNSITWKWQRDFKKVLPDYRVLVIGSSINSRGIATPDSADLRARKWAEFAAGLWDVALLTESMIGSTRLLPATLEDYSKNIAAVRRMAQLRREENDKKKEQAEKKASKRRKTERAEAVEEEAGIGWVLSMLQGNIGTHYDPGLAWEEIGVDLLMVDEAQGYKGLFGLGAREGGIPEGIGSTNASKKSWHLDFRAHAVRQRSGGAGIFLLSATPAKNSPVELYNLVHMVDPDLWERAGITDPEAFFDHFCELSFSSAQRPNGTIVTRSAVKSFRNLDNLRALLARYTEFKTAEDVGLKIPEAINRGISPEEFIDLSPSQSEAMSKILQEILTLQNKLLSAPRGPEGAAARMGILMQIMSRAMQIDMVSLHAELPQLRSEPDPEAIVDPDDPKAPVERIRYTDAEVEERARALDLKGKAPKLEKAVRTITQTRRTTCEAAASDDGCCLSCGHVVFADNQGVHYMVERLLIEGGIPPERIAILNGYKAKDPETRQRIAMAFNGVGCKGDPEYLPPAYDVVIANRVAYEGVDLQRRTCMIHHLDLPWEPATLRQRNGRGVRQGNLFSDVEVHYYLARKSLDIRRLLKIQNKAGWLNQLFGGTMSTTSNPMAKEELTPDEIILELGDDEARAAVRDSQARREKELVAERLKNQRRTGNSLLNKAHARFRLAERAATPQHAQAYRAEAEALLHQLAQLPPASWPWHDLALRVRTERAFIPEEGPPLFDGDRWQVGDASIEIGAISPGGYPFALTQGGAHFRRLDEERKALLVEFTPVSLPSSAPWTPRDQEEASLKASAIYAYAEGVFGVVNWFASSTRFREDHGDALLRLIAEKLREAARSPYADFSFNRVLPVLRGGQLEPLPLPDQATAKTLIADLDAGRASILPPTPAGLATFRALLPAARERFKASELEPVAMTWWGLKLAEVQRT